jgi:hypothetical protein
MNTNQVQAQAPVQGNLAMTQATAAQAALAPIIDLPLLIDPNEVILAAQENTVEGERFPFDRIKMPAGGGISFELQDENGEATSHSALKVIVIGFKPFKSWYEKSYDQRDPDEEMPLPDCFSADTVTGSGCNCETYQIPAGQACAGCPLNQWGSSRRGGRGKECHDRMRVWFLLEGYAVPMYIDLPKTSLTNFKDYRKRLTKKAKVIYGVVTVIKLEKSINEKKIEYSKAAFSSAGDIAPSERAEVKRYMDAISNSLRIDRDTITDIQTPEHEAEEDESFNKVVDKITNDQAY